MSFPEDMKRGRRKGISGNQAVVRRYVSDKYNTSHELKDKVRKKANKGQCRITIPRSIADSMGLKDNDVVEFTISTGKSCVITKIDVRELE